MSKSIKFKNNVYLDCRSISFNRKNLQDLLTNLFTRKDYQFSGTIGSGDTYNELCRIANDDEQERLCLMYVYIKYYSSNNVSNCGAMISDQWDSELAYQQCQTSKNAFTTRLCITYPCKWSKGSVGIVKGFQNSGSSIKWEVYIKALYVNLKPV